jgi:hypothetical protein
MLGPSVVRAIAAGIAAWIAFVLILLAYPSLDISSLDVAQMLGGVFGLNNAAAGWAFLFVAGIFFALAYAGWFVDRLPGPAWQRGLMYAVIPWLVMAVVVAPLLPVLNPTMDPRTVPGVYFSNLGLVAAFGMLVAFLAWGVVLGAVYSGVPERKVNVPAGVILLLPFLIFIVLVATQKRYSPIVIVQDLSGVTTYDPARATDADALPVIYNVYDRLVSRVESGQIVPELATHWTVSPDGLVYTFELQSGVLFPSGVELSADDVMWSVRRLKYLRSGPSRLADAITDVRAIEHYVVRITLARPVQDFLSLLASPQFSILDGRTVLAQAGTAEPNAAERDAATAWLTTHSAGTGPWLLVRYTPHREAVLIPNPNYWRGNVYQGKVIFKDHTTAAARLRDVESGRADVALDLPASDAAVAHESAGIRLLESAAGPVPVRTAVHGVDVGPTGILDLRDATKE